MIEIFRIPQHKPEFSHGSPGHNKQCKKIDDLTYFASADTMTIDDFKNCKKIQN